MWNHLHFDIASRLDWTRTRASRVIRSGVVRGFWILPASDYVNWICGYPDVELVEL